MADKLTTDQLLDLYKIAIEEYRFEVKLNWDRTMYYIVFNSALIAAATGILKPDNGRIINSLTALIYLLSAAACFIGQSAIEKGHQYYRRTVIKKTLIEELLGLTAKLEGYPTEHDLSIGTTAGQNERWRQIYDTDIWLQRSVRKRSITAMVRVFLFVLVVIDMFGATGAGYLVYIGAPAHTATVQPVWTSHLPKSRAKTPPSASEQIAPKATQ